MKLFCFNKRTVGSKVALVCVATLLLTGTSVATRPTHAFVIELTLTERIVIQAFFATARYLFGRSRGPERRGKNLVDMQVPQSAVGTVEAQKQVQCMVDLINNVVRGNPKGVLGRKFFGGETKKVKIKSGKLKKGTLGQAQRGASVNDVAEITLDLEQIRNKPVTDNYELNVTQTVFHELWHVANPQDRTHEPGKVPPMESQQVYWTTTEFGGSQKRAWQKVFGDTPPNFKVANGHSRKKNALIRPGTPCLWKPHGRKQLMHGR